MSDSADSVLLRLATDADKAWLFDLHMRLFKDHIDKIWGWDTVQQIEIFNREWEESQVRVIELGGERAGWLQEKDLPETLVLLSLAFDTDFQSRGIGAEVLRRLKAEATDARKSIQLNVFRTNPRAAKFYERHGFRPIKIGENGTRMEWSPNRSSTADRD